jgi:GNAT superfamily N-acetyltransferase
VSVPIEIRGYRPGDIGWTVQAHAVYYATHWSLPAAFECDVAKGLAALVARLDPARDGFWIATAGDDRAGAIAIDGSSEPGWARLRFFITDDRHRGRGIGRLLVAHALAFCAKAGHRDVYLTTFAGLDAARHLYETNGFALVDERVETTWGRPLAEQLFERRTLPA